MGLNTTLHDVDGCMGIELKEDKTQNIEGTEVSTFTTDTISLADEKLFDILSKIQDSTPPECLEYFQKSEIPF